MHVVKQIFSLLSALAITSCGTMPVPGIGESSNNQPVKHNESASNNSSAEEVSLQNVETSQKKELPVTSYLANVTDTQESKNLMVENPSAPSNEAIKSTGVNKTNVGVENESKQLDYIVTADGLIKEVPASKQSTIPNQEPVLSKTKANISKSTTNNEQEVRIQLALANRYYKSAKYQNAIDLLETPVSNNKTNVNLSDLLVLSYTKYANELVSKANLLEAQTILEKAVSIEPNNAELQKQLKKIKNTREANRIYQLGLEAVNSGDNIDAFKSFQKVLVLNPSHSMAKQQVVKIRAPVIESRYKEAMQHYRKQELTNAIQAWDDVLDMDPKHELAKLYRARAVELKQKIDVIGRQ